MGDAELITAIKNTPVPTILVIAGLGFLLLALAGRIAGRVEIPPERQKWAALVGLLVLITGISLHLSPSGATDMNVSLKVNVAGQGSVSPPGGEFQKNGELEIVPTADSGWSFQRWQGDCKGTTIPCILTMDSDKQVTGVFTEINQEARSQTEPTRGPTVEQSRESEAPLTDALNDSAEVRSTIDDVGVYRPSTNTWYYDHDHNGKTDEEYGWALEGDLPISGDFDRDGYVDDVGVYRPTASTWYYDHDHDGHTDERHGRWGFEGDLPISGDFDS